MLFLRLVEVHDSCHLCTGILLTQLSSNMADAKSKIMDAVKPYVNKVEQFLKEDNLVAKQFGTLEAKTGVPRIQLCLGS